mmetsp:Transcript_24683/g.54119  ORF Transcript_24683/g.54119 Transcript_24683/m.54119 type:complete len:286 (+) Transcript_24683:790-1647(+)
MYVVRIIRMKPVMRLAPPEEILEIMKLTAEIKRHSAAMVRVASDDDNENDDNHHHQEAFDSCSRDRRIRDYGSRMPMARSFGNAPATPLVDSRGALFVVAPPGEDSEPGPVWRIGIKVVHRHHRQHRLRWGVLGVWSPGDGVPALSGSPYPTAGRCDLRLFRKRCARTRFQNRLLPAPAEPCKGGAASSSVRNRCPAGDAAGRFLRRRPSLGRSRADGKQLQALALEQSDGRGLLRHREIQDPSRGYDMGPAAIIKLSDAQRNRHAHGYSLDNRVQHAEFYGQCL